MAYIYRFSAHVVPVGAFHLVQLIFSHLCLSTISALNSSSSIDLWLKDTETGSIFSSTHLTIQLLWLGGSAVNTEQKKLDRTSASSLAVFSDHHLASIDLSHIPGRLPFTGFFTLSSHVSRMLWGFVWLVWQFLFQF